ncbi:serine/threonine-protein kinase Nek8-like isoform X2 [Ornithodoros turicata]|uniref:serine/threonine-protein kinase Nek8-like isoform X2 n=1 Tax=Ornithodoros turicata TaxID=34597 RepID=UPI0031388542
MNKYEKVRIVGRGSSGTVHLCCEKATKKCVIIKEIPVAEMTEEERESSLTEAKVLAMLDHTNIIAYYDNFLEDKSMVIVMEYAPGGTLYDHIKARGKALFQEEEVLSYFAQILLALEHVHSRQILHRDLKTQNLLLNQNKNVVKMVGTPSNLSPEICMGKPYNQKSDIWALGCVLYEMLTLKSPFSAETLPALIQKIMIGNFDPIAKHYSSGIKEVVTSLLHSDPTRRPSVRHLMCHPVVMPVLCALYCNLGALPCVSKSNRSSSTSLHRTLSRPVIAPEDATSVLLWKPDVIAPTHLELPKPGTRVTHIAAGKQHIFAVTTSGTVVTWKRCDEKEKGLVCQPSIMRDKVTRNITYVACGKDFTILLSETGILVSFGNGSSGCLGHGDRHDTEHPKIIEALLGYHVVSIACGDLHVVAVTKDNHVFAWGNADNGRMGLELPSSVDTPQNCGLPKGAHPVASFCGSDCSFLAGSAGELWVCGSNRNNKLGFCNPSKLEEDNVFEFTSIESKAFLGAPIVSVASTVDHTFVLTDIGAVYVLGFEESPCAAASPMSPIKMVSMGERVTHIACTNSTLLAATEHGHLMKWGKPSSPASFVELFPSFEVPKNNKVISLTSNEDIAVAATLGTPTL